MSYIDPAIKKESKIGAFTISLIVLLTSLFISQYVSNLQQNALSQILSGQVKQTDLKLINSTRSLIAEINGMTKRWINNNSTPEENWRADARDFIARIKGLSSIWWIDKNKVYQWGESKNYNHNNKIAQLLNEAEIKEILDTVKVSFIPEFTSAHMFDGAQWIYVFLPIGHNQIFDGYFVIEVNIKAFIDEVLGDPQLTGFYTEATANDSIVYSNGEDLQSIPYYDSFVLSLDSDDNGWEFRVYPTETSTDMILSPLSYFIIGTGTIISLLFLLTLLSRLKAKNQSLELSKQISETEKVQFELEYLANHDTLTHLPNRHYITGFIERKVKLGLANKQNFTILFIDLDHFKDINDTLGHAVGDEMLKKLPVLFNRVFRHDDVIARMGGDEFVVYLPGRLEKNDLTNLVERFLKSLEYPIQIDEHQIRLTGSVGVAFFPQHGNNVIELLSHADAALYRAKADGRNTYAIYDSAIEQKAKDRIELISRLHLAHENNEFEMYFQPRYRLSDECMLGAEALMRWRPNKETVIKPEKFIDILEETALIIPVTWKMFESSCVQFKKLLDQGNHLSLSFNISARQLEHPDFISKLKLILTKTAYPPQNLELELTEQTLIQNVENSRFILNKLSSMGISIAIDDFGTGYSSLSYLKNFPVDVLKIDQSFIHDIVDDRGDLELVKTMIAMGKNLNIRTVAEGVENESQLKLIQNEDCDEVQGYYFNKPMNFETFCKIIEANRK
ncbi:putative bifunctional diguanylate cyclase/phosphodiesterase [Marinicella litoralis]|uniref:Diguanylate cyclase (GGDEF)-like protein n=1 Tax=Marinicella litoralis TaxID=644220 RepID=A0A4R6XVF8_9GAMM|nr:bifunctional diguanylate cyclase/phosphodiesterase [Marinicella litoralis]TDR22380.1 diguanylate cyclase (GGDEF)-like protein [Marinicella litoralis]